MKCAFNKIAFHPGCIRLSSVVIPTSMSNIGDSTFYGTHHIVIMILISVQ